ncbi:hypothetical protein BIY23_01135 [Wolbachia pipientis]|uniref:Uncharacterized protein n=1 Tax=Wolbachia pipientis TaxID=955 RepID=A0A1E7QLI2_WOLPI|nr:ankyrin repeat domain-containing protein [Wolbachia pipientis]OEY87074.1 hypothetical protein BIY23_01135 [Wolbachia pipientis]
MLCLVCKNNCIAIAKVMIAEGASVNVKDFERNSPLHLAMCNSNTEVIDHLLRNNADKEAKNDKEETAALVVARWCQNVQCIRMLNY